MPPSTATQRSPSQRTWPGARRPTTCRCSRYRTATKTWKRSGRRSRQPRRARTIPRSSGSTRSAATARPTRPTATTLTALPLDAGEAAATHKQLGGKYRDFEVPSQVWLPISVRYIYCILGAAAFRRASLDGLAAYVELLSLAKSTWPGARRPTAGKCSRYRTATKTWTQYGRRSRQPRLARASARSSGSRRSPITARPASTSHLRRTQTSPRL